ncbi:MAG: DNA polymerase III subunit delta' [Gammaproteobacteria bacterium]|nr:DNA polymerase III subunit delta' [Gammaproteobacteria bacterium]MCK5091288.1 DNA polymerase III subunit delta' [Gammaproteobacteria bacterium]
MKEDILPWQASNWQRLQSRLVDHTLPHALLLSGPVGLGKSLFARQLTQSLLCEDRNEETGTACGHCKPCNLFTAGTHPDIYSIGLEEDSKLIKIDQIRALTEKLGLKSQQGGYRVIVINPADRLNTAAANSLLKTLEEPGENTVLILITDRPGQLPITIRSRCQKMSFTPPSRQMALEWLHTKLKENELENETGQPDAALLLAMAGGAPLKVLEINDSKYLEGRRELLGEFLALHQGKMDPVTMAGKWHKNSLESCLEWFTGWISDIVQLKFTQNPPNLRNPDLLSTFQTLADHLNIIWLYQFQDKLKQAGYLAETTVNRQLLLEDLLITWAGSGRSHRKAG